MLHFQFITIVVLGSIYVIHFFSASSIIKYYFLNVKNIDVTRNVEKIVGSVGDVSRILVNHHLVYSNVLSFKLYTLH